MRLKDNQKAFLDLLRAGLWENEASLSRYKDIDYPVFLQLAEEQSVVGVVAAGMEHVHDVKVPKEIALQFFGQALQMEQRNLAMNDFIASLIKKLKNAGVHALLVKGQGIAQCYERPFRRASGDIDLFLDSKNYSKASTLLTAIADSTEEDKPETKHFAMTIGPWSVELHGTLRSQLGKRIDNVIDEVQEDTFANRRVRSWDHKGTEIFIPAPDNDLIFIFTHILQHFFREGIGLRQICDWCRLLWTYRDSINVPLLKGRLNRMGVMPEWKSFAYLAVNSLGMPEEAMPFYSTERKWKRKAGEILSYIIETGSFGYSLDYSYYQKYPFFIYKAISLWRHTDKAIRHFRMFPSVSLNEWGRMIRQGFIIASKEIKQRG